MVDSQEFATAHNLVHTGNPVAITRISSLEHPQDNSALFVFSADILKRGIELGRKNCVAISTPEILQNHPDVFSQFSACIAADKPRLILAHLTAHFAPTFETGFIHPSAVIEHFGNNCRRCPHRAFVLGWQEYCHRLRHKSCFACFCWR